MLSCLDFNNSGLWLLMLNSYASELQTVVYSMLDHSKLKICFLSKNLSVLRLVLLYQGFSLRQRLSAISPIFVTILQEKILFLNIVIYWMDQVFQYLLWFSFQVLLVHYNWLMWFSKQIKHWLKENCSSVDIEMPSSSTWMRLMVLLFSAFCK